jgi:hypothetical protein
MALVITSLEFNCKPVDPVCLRMVIIITFFLVYPDENVKYRCKGDDQSEYINEMIECIPSERSADIVKDQFDHATAKILLNLPEKSFTSRYFKIS